MQTQISSGLRKWFVIHSIVDVIFAVPLMLAPVSTLQIFGWTAIDPLATRLVAAALVGIGVESYLGRNASAESFRTMLRLKILWSLAAICGIAATLWQGGVPPVAWIVLAVFMFFSTLWIYYRLRLR